MSATEYAIELARVVAYAALDKKGFDIVALDVSEHLAITDIFVVISAANERQVSAVVDAVDKAMHEHKAHRARREGRTREPLGTTRLHRHRGARAASGGARVVLPGETVEGLPVGRSPTS